MNLRWLVLIIRMKRTEMILFASSKQKHVIVLLGLKRIDYMEKMKFGWSLFTSWANFFLNCRKPYSPRFMDISTWTWRKRHGEAFSDNCCTAASRHLSIPSALAHPSLQEEIGRVAAVLILFRQSKSLIFSDII